ncbi:cobalamin trafficking protein CblD-like isoform X6 [Acropora palmata]|uniref:cobalamin trafficking protein CblD-like isoform X6 n=1 Tax=Acropora palmata TaxID=6131 RepID=UPI003DA12B81
MASKALRKTTRAVRYFPNLRAAVNLMVKNLRQGAELSTSSADTAVSGSVQPPNWPDTRLGPFAPKDPKFPLPGNVGVDLAQLPQAASFHRRTVSEALLDLESEDVRKAVALDCYVKDISEENYGEEVLRAQNNSSVGTVECSVQQCPGFLHHSFMELFPDIAMHQGQLTVISISQRTKNDMSAWSAEVEDERDNLMASFVESAKEICNSLLAGGYWADFIDPSSGTAYFGSHTNSCLFETDERFNHLGFNVTDLGCCKAISHPLWGSFVFVGTIFTNAPANSDALGNTLFCLQFSSSRRVKLLFLRCILFGGHLHFC